jgi:FlaA1/EpsC-like NDP-sugar epimerase
MATFTRRLMLLASDAILLNLSIIASLFIRFDSIHIPVQYQEVFYSTFLTITLVNLAIYYVFGLYKNLWQYASINELAQIFFATLTGSVVSYIVGLSLKMPLPRSIYIIFWLMVFFLLGATRISYRMLRMINGKYFSGQAGTKKIMVIGAGDAGAIVIRELNTHKELNSVPVVIIDDDKWKKSAKIHGVPIFGDRRRILEAVEKFDIDEIIIAMPSAPKKELTGIYNICKQTKCKLKTLPGVFELINENVGIKHLRDVEIEDLLGREEVQLDTCRAEAEIRDEVVLVTGAGGSIGSELCRQIIKFKPKKLIIFDIYENNAYDLQNELKYTYKDEIELVVAIGSVRDKNRLDYIFNLYKPKIVYHAAAHKHVPLMEANPAEAVKNNVLGTLNTAQAADKYDVNKFVLISTDKAVNPTNIMGASKRMAEMIVQSLDKESNTKFMAVRFGNVLGSNGSVIPLFKKQIAHGGPVTITHPEIIRYFMTIPEAARLVIQAGTMANGGEVFILDMGKPVKIVDLATDLIRLSGLEPDVDIDIVFTGLRPGEKLYEELLMDEEGIQKTKNEKIFVGKPSDLTFNEVMMKIRALENSMDSPESMMQCMAAAVPTYKCKGMDINDIATAGISKDPSSQTGNSAVVAAAGAKRWDNEGLKVVK